MLVYFLFILLILFFQITLNNIPYGENRNRIEKRFLNTLAGILILLTAIRGAGVGTDTRNYLIMYVHHTPTYSFSDPYSAFNESPLTFYLFKVFSLLHLPPQFLLGFIEFIYISAIVRFINKFSKDKLYSFFCFFIIVGLYDFSVPALKQTCAMGLMLHSFLYLYEKKWIKLTLCVITAFFFHKSSIIFSLGFILFFFRNKSYYYHLIVVFCLLCVFGGGFLLNFGVNTISSEHYSVYLADQDKYTLATLFYYLVLFFIAFVFKKQYDKSNKEESKIVYGYTIITMALQSLASITASAFRLAVYFLPFLIILLPNSFMYGGGKGRQFKVVTTLFLLFFYIYTTRNGGNIVPYKFFWQDYDIPYIYFGG